uniref:HLF transcription factor, PAR bZIP family member n=1 Tax=Oryctolagus cuniculus TaxID=9986 RepID=A0A5F9DUF9_RABIT
MHVDDDCFCRFPGSGLTYKRRKEPAFGKEKDKEKKLDDESGSPTVPQSAFLGPTLWDKTLPYDGDTFQLEYMDLEEFLSENGIPPSPSQQDHSPHPAGLQPAPAAAPSVMDLSSRASAPIHPGIPSPNCMQNPIRPGQLLPANRNTPSPIDPDTIQVPVGYEPDPADLALSSIPGQEMFDPRKRKFSEEELKPQPMIKKARKVFIPDDLKPGPLPRRLRCVASTKMESANSGSSELWSLHLDTVLYPGSLLWARLGWADHGAAVPGVSYPIAFSGWSR